MNTQMNPVNANMLYVLTASHCCLCHKSLKDAESVENGIGPKCSKRYYDPTHVPSEEDVMNALGLLHLGMTEGKFPAELISDLRALKGNARLFSNRLVYFISSAYDQRDVVLAAAGIIRALGYVVMADKLEIDRVKAQISDLDADNFKVLMARSDDCDRDMRRIPGALDNLPKEDRKFGWTVPKDQKDHLLCLLGVHFCGHLMAVEGEGISVIRKRSWYELRRFRNPPKPRPAVPAPAPAPRTDVLSALTPDGPVEIDVGARDLEVRTPYKASFKEALKSDIPYRDRSWQRCWVVKAVHLDMVKGLIETHFGVTL